MVQKIAADAFSAARADVIFALLKDPVRWSAWSDMQSSLGEPAAGDPLGVGSTRVNLRGRVRGIDRIVELVPGKRFGYVHLHGLPVRDYRGEVDLEPHDGGTQIHWRATFRAAIPGTGWFWRLGLRRFLQQMTDGLASYAATQTRPADRPS